MKKILLGTCTLLLLLRFAFLLGDPRVYDIDGASSSPAFAAFGGLIDGVYLLSNLLMLPANGLYDLLRLLIPGLKTAGFPAMEASQLAGAIGRWMQGNPGLPIPMPVRELFSGPHLVQNFPGVVDWLTLITLAGLWGLSPVIDPIGRWARNLLWNVFIEASFTRKKKALYQHALQQRATDLMKLNVEYRNLSREASVLKDTVITDDLTQVYNKRYFLQKFHETFDAAKSQQTLLGLIMMDIDHFKRLNDEYGHLAGDVALKAIAGVASGATPPACYLCRFGGEEFAMVLPGQSLEDTLAAADRIRMGVPELRFEFEPGLRVTISQGVAHLDFSKPLAQTLAKADQFIKLADDELYRAKLEGRDRICHTPLG